MGVVGAPFLDLTFEGLARLPAPGEELVGTNLHLTPGGTGMQAVAASRLGLRTALIAAVGTDAAGRILAGLLSAEGVTWAGPETERTPVTVILPSGDAAAMATFQPSEDVTRRDVASARADAVILSLGRVSLRAPGASTYVVTGPGEMGRFGPADVASLEGVRAVVMNELEARSLTGADDAPAAARVLAAFARSAVVTRGARGAVGAEGDAVVDVAAPEVQAVDSTGAGDLFVAAYVWADRGELDLESRVRWSTLYATLSTREPTALAGAIHLDALLAEGERRGLTPP